MNILEAKLSADHKNDLKDSEFGLPKERKFPLNDESHVRSAIRFFKYSKLEQRRELAKNINTKLRKFDLKIKVDKSNPFYKFIDRKYLLESIDENIVTENSFIYQQGTIDDVYFDRIICVLMSKSSLYVDESFIINYEDIVYEALQDKNDNVELLNFIATVNDLFECIYSEYLEFMNYDNNTNFTNLYYALLNDYRKVFLYKIHHENNIKNIQHSYSNFIDMLETVNDYRHNWYYVNRIDSEIYYTILTSNFSNISDDVDLNVFRHKVIKYGTKINIPFNGWGEVLPSDQQADRFLNTKGILEDKKKQLENQLYIIRKNIDLSGDISLSKNIHTLYHIDNPEIENKINMISYYCNLPSFTILKNITYTLTEEDKIRLCKTKHINNLISSDFADGKLYWFGTDNINLYIICKSLETDNITYKLILVDDTYLDYLRQLINYVPKIKVITLTFPLESNDIDFDFEKLTEGFSVNENGDIKIVLDPKKTYMEEYMETHRILVENYKNKNYEAMKQNVAYMFMLISLIEKDHKYRKREPEVVKARAFIINDFKTYLSHIQKADPEFNFEIYYKNLELDKQIINIPKETILGIRNLLKTIIL